MSKWIKVSGSFGIDDNEITGSFFGGKKGPKNNIVSKDNIAFAVPPPSVSKLKNYIVSECKGDAYEIFLWERGKSIVNNPPREIRNIVMSMNPKITGSNFLIDNIDAVNYFKSWVPMKTLDDEAFEYILDNNEKYLKLYRAFGRPTQKQNLQIIKKMEYGTEEEGFLSYDNIEALDKGGEKLLGQKSVKKDYPEMPPILKSSSAIRKDKI